MSEHKTEKTHATRTGQESEGQEGKGHSMPPPAFQLKASPLPKAEIQSSQDGASSMVATHEEGDSKSVSRIALTQTFANPNAGTEPTQGPIKAPDIEASGIMQSSLDTIKATITSSSTVAEAGATPGGYGVTNTTLAMKNIVVTPGTGKFTVQAEVVATITWKVRSGVGPAGEIDIESENDPDITAANYKDVAKALTPDMSDLNGRPPRDGFWAEDLTRRHERFHAVNQRQNKFVPKSTQAMQKWLNKKTSASAADITATLLPQGINEFVRVFNTFVALPSTEGDAYKDGASSYKKRAKAIKKKGDAGKY